MDEQGRKVCLGLLKLFKIEGKPADEVATEGNLEIFHAIVSRKWNRVQIISATQYGKSLFVALGCIILSCIEGELVSIVAPTDSKAAIIMRYYIQHIGDNPMFYTKLSKDTPLDKLQMETSKDRITLKNKGGIYTLSVQAGNTQKGFEAAMGEGCKTVILDEGALVPDTHEATIFRMGAGKTDFTYIKIGNPFYRNHFFKSAKDKLYHQIFIDYERGLREGRYTQAFIEEAKKKPLFDILYGCKFPPDNTTDDKGYTRLFPDILLERCQRETPMYGEKRMGSDIAEGGGDNNAFVLRGANYAKKLVKFQSDDTMLTTGRIIHEARLGKTEEEKGDWVYDHNWFVDSLGVGKGVYDRLVEQLYRPFGVRFSEKADDDTQFANQRAECYWRAFKWLSEGGSLEPDSDWEQLSWIKYKVDSKGKIQIMPKELMKKEGHSSPDVADAFVSTFARKSIINISKEQTSEEKKILSEFDAYKNKKVTRKNLRGRV